MLIYVFSQISDEFYTEGSGPCQNNPCQGGGMCEEHDGTFTCFCTSDRTGDRCEKELSEHDIKIAKFSRHSFVELQPLKNGDHKISIDIEFHPSRKKSNGHTQNVEDGILLYAHQNPNADGDFISLAIVDK